MLLSILFVGLNGYFAFRSYKQKQWGWFAVSMALAVFCALPLFARL